MTDFFQGHLRKPAFRSPRRGFTLIEVLLSATIIVMLCGMLIQVTNMTGKIWKNTQAKVEQFQAARTAFDSMTRKIGQATLNTYWDYDKPDAISNAGSAPAKYIRQSELRFICGDTAALVGSSTRSWTTKGIFFHAPLGFTAKPEYRGMEDLLNAWGYFVEFGDDRDLRPPVVTEAIIPKRDRFRLYEMMVPSDYLSTYNDTSGVTPVGRPKNMDYARKDWFSAFINTPVGGRVRPVHVLAENVVALLFVPKLSKNDEDRRASEGKQVLCKNYAYDSRYDSSANYTDPEINPSNQLPPIVQVTMVALDEASGAKLASEYGTAMPRLGINLFQDTTKLFDEKATSAPSDGDLSKLTEELVSKRLNYRIFTTNVSIRAARWSREQK